MRHTSLTAWILGLCLAFSWSYSSGIFAAEPPGAPNAAEVFRAVSPSAISVIALDADGNPFAQGSGVILNRDGVAVTNYHVVRGASSVMAIDAEGTQVSVTGWTAYDPYSDLILIILAKGEWSGVPFTPHAPQPGDRVFALASPKGMSQTFADGMVSAIRRVGHRFTYIQTTAPTSPGSSGGALVDDRGRLIGIMSQKLVGGENINFAISHQSVAILLSRQMERPASFDMLPDYWIKKASLILQKQDHQHDQVAAEGWLLAAASAASCGDLEWALQANAQAEELRREHIRSERSLGYLYARYVESLVKCSSLRGNFDHALKFAASDRLTARGYLFTSVARVAAQYGEPDLALSFANRIPIENAQMSNEDRRSAVEAISAALIDADRTDEALALLNSIKVSDRNQTMRPAMKRLIAKGDLNSIEHLLASYHDADRDELCIFIAGELADIRQFDAAADWLNQVAAIGEYQSSALVLYKLNRRDEATVALESWFRHACRMELSKPPATEPPDAIEAHFVSTSPDETFRLALTLLGLAQQIESTATWNLAFKEAKALMRTQHSVAAKSRAACSLIRRCFEAGRLDELPELVTQLEQLGQPKDFIEAMLLLGEFDKARAALRIGGGNRENKPELYNVWSGRLRDLASAAGRDARQGELAKLLLLIDHPSSQVSILLAFAQGLMVRHSQMWMADNPSFPL